MHTTVRLQLYLTVQSRFPNDLTKFSNGLNIHGLPATQAGFATQPKNRPGWQKINAQTDILASATLALHLYEAETGRAAKAAQLIVTSVTTPADYNH